MHRIYAAAERLTNERFFIYASPPFWDAAQRSVNVLQSIREKKVHEAIIMMVNDEQLFFFQRTEDLRQQLAPVRLIPVMDFPLMQVDEILSTLRIKSSANQNSKMLEALSLTLGRQAEAEEIELNGKQLRMLLDALDLYVRLGIGQFEALVDEATLNAELNDDFWTKRNQLIFACQHFKSLLGYDLNGSYGILHPGIGRHTRCAWDLKKVCEKAYAETFDRLQQECGYPVENGFKNVMHDGLIVSAATEFEHPRAYHVGDLIQGADNPIHRAGERF